MVCPRCGKVLELRFSGIHVEILWCEACKENYEKQIGDTDNAEQECFVPTREEVL